MTTSFETEVVTKFGTQADNTELLDKCQHLCSLFGLTVEELFFKWESYVITTSSIDNDLPFNLSNLDSLQEFIQKKIVKENKTPHSKRHLKSSIPSTPSSNTKKRKLQFSSPTNNNNDNSSNNNDNINNTPINVSIISAPASSSKAASDSGKLIESLNNEISITSNDTHEKNIRLIANFDPKKYKYRTMNQKLLEVADYLDDQIDLIAELISKHYKIDPSNFGNPNLQSQSEIFTVGRIVPDNPLTSSNDQLNLSSLFLETSRSGGIGQRIPLDLSLISDADSFFPGQIVCFKGLNSTGETFKVLKRFKIPYLGSLTTSINDINNYREQLNSENLNIVLTSGPYTNSKSLDFSLLNKFVDRMNSEVKPHVIIMLGPFIDINHPSIKSGKFLDNDFNNLDELFKFLISPILKRLDCSKIILIPHCSDVTTTHVCYPQDSMDRKFLGLTKNFKCFPNPSTFSLNELLIGISNLDVFKTLKDVNGQGNRFERIVDYILEQRRYYPYLPSPKDINLHLSYMGLSELSDMPDILILPSELKSFAKVIKNVVVINPGQFIKRDFNGTYAVLRCKSPNIEDFEKIVSDEEEYLVNIWKRCRVDIYRT